MSQKNNTRLGYKHQDHSVQVDTIGHLSPLAVAVCQRLADDPFVTQRTLAQSLNISAQELQQISNIVRMDGAAQNYIMHGGSGTKYWTNTVTPLLLNGSLHAAIDNYYMYPNRVGLYTGMSCMFYCNFCGRNPVAKYNKSYEQIGFDVFKQIIDQDPKTDAHWEDRFRISGGLEPLTNRYLGDIISYGASKGYKMQLYTNGFMMTDKYISEHPGMKELYAVRFSLYGVDAASAFNVTRHPNSFENIIDNVINYINNTTSTKVGLNWIILPGHSQDVLKLIDIVDHINKTASRPVDFVTLREDFSQSVRVISDQERASLIEIFDQIQQFKKYKWPSTHWDFGYALEPLVHGRNAGPLTMISWQDMVPESFPQVAVAVDVKGDVYVYHESGFLDRPGADRYIIGNVANSSVQQVVKDFVGKRIRPLPPDVSYLDAFDHVVSRLINQARDDQAFGIPWNQGPVACR
jgi:dTDP-4-amino-4,6-dideoxy-D-glucose ammonia-lyase